MLNPCPHKETHIGVFKQMSNQPIFLFLLEYKFLILILSPCAAQHGSHQAPAAI